MRKPTSQPVLLTVKETANIMNIGRERDPSMGAEAVDTIADLVRGSGK